MRKLVFGSILLNIGFILLLYFLIHRLGGWRYCLHRLRQDQAGLYAHRVQLFERLPVKKGAIVFVGDSQVENCEWSELFSLDSIAVLNRGISGDQTYGLTKRMSELLRHEPRVIFLEIGINDLLLGVPMEEIKGRYQEIVQRIRNEAPDAALYLCSVLPVNNNIKQIGIENEQIEALNKELEKIARAYTLPFVDLSTVLKDQAGNLNDKYTDDGIHLNGEAYLLLKNVFQKKNELLQ